MAKIKRKIIKIDEEKCDGCGLLLLYNSVEKAEVRNGKSYDIMDTRDCGWVSHSPKF